MSDNIVLTNTVIFDGRSEELTEGMNVVIDQGLIKEISKTASLQSAQQIDCGSTILERTLKRGFTTVRDAAGGDRGMWEALQRGLVRGPRFFFPGKALTQTGGHGDMRPGNEVPCACGRFNGVLTPKVTT